ncbi:hypothetical protein ASF47_19280 [Nocardioides sp. Leaf285]|nr:hypothetical protein ASF47_19280 [Nocardioides sp. Leaf285]
MRREATGAKQAGLALLDVLLGMAIFALIIIIAIQSVNQYRQRAFQSAAQSDVQQASIGLESYFTDNQAYPASGSTAGTISAAKTSTAATQNAATLSALGTNLTKNTFVWSYTPNSANGTFTMCIAHTSAGLGTTALTGAGVDAWASYNSATGAIDASGRGPISGTATAATNGACL